MDYQILLRSRKLLSKTSSIHYLHIAIILGLFSVSSIKGFSQPQSANSYSFMFYNVENAFDCFDDTLNVGDDEFLPDAKLIWTYNRFQEKVNHIAKTIIAAGEWNPPALIGMCEIENKTVMNQIVFKTGLKDMGYRFIHYESPDYRGIDVGLIYNKKLFKPISSYPNRIVLPDGRTTRDILYVKGVLSNHDTIHVLVNHWPSRRGGQVASDPNRMAASQKLKDISDSISLVNPKSLIIAMGDFNDSSMDESLQYLTRNTNGNQLINMSAFQTGKHSGSNKYKEKWELIDQMLVSKAMIDHWLGAGSNINFKVIDLLFLLEDDSTYFGDKPFRSFRGPIYTGGFSDHLPVMSTFKK